MRRASWLSAMSDTGGGLSVLAPGLRSALSDIDDALFAMWGLGDNLVLAWTQGDRALQFLAVRHYAIPEAIHGTGHNPAGVENAVAFVNDLLSGSKYLEPDRFDRACKALGAQPRSVPVGFRIGVDVPPALISELVRRYSASLVRGRAVMLLDAVEFSLQPPLDQMAMLNSLSYSVNSAYQQLLSKDIHVNFARTTTGDGFYIWNREPGPAGNVALYKLMMMILADNAIAQRKASSAWVPRLRAAFHIGEHYEFHQVDGLNPTTFSYIVGQVTIDLSRMIEKALPGQILLGDFETGDHGKPGPGRHDTLDFVERTAATLEQLKGLAVSGGHIEQIRCYLTGKSLGGGRYLVNRYHIRDKHGTTRVVYNAKINIHRDNAEPIYLGIQSDDLWAFASTKVEAVNRDASETGSFFIKP
ncbi:MAG TPA: hypothetical protein VNM24_15340 [Burkholderiales bacterium]|jgi:hypothetical protein|nr:hypothetical protein [Burkholderiales bacterium]